MKIRSSSCACSSSRSKQVEVITSRLKAAQGSEYDDTTQNMQQFRIKRGKECGRKRTPAASLKKTWKQSQRRSAPEQDGEVPIPVKCVIIMISDGVDGQVREREGQDQCSLGRVLRMHRLHRPPASRNRETPKMIVISGVRRTNGVSRDTLQWGTLSRHLKSSWCASLALIKKYIYHRLAIIRILLRSQAKPIPPALVQEV